MFRKCLRLALSVCLVGPVFAAERERVFDFATLEQGAVPPGFVSMVTGTGKPGLWEILSDDAPTAFPSVTGRAAATSKQKVLAQLSRDPGEEHFLFLMLTNETYGDFTFTTRVKMVEGDVEQMAGLAFRIQDEQNYYVVRANSKDGNLRFYKFVNGVRSDPIGPKLTVAKGEWHELSVTCKGNQIRVSFNGEEAIPTLTDTSFSSGKLGFWTKSDAVSYFVNARLTYTPREKLAEMLVRDVMKQYDRLKNVQIIAPTATSREPIVVASSATGEAGRPAAAEHRQCLADGTSYYLKDGKVVIVTVPLHDHNGDVAAAVQLTMESFPGQTQANALTRAKSVLRVMEARVTTQKDLVD